MKDPIAVNYEGIYGKEVWELMNPESAYPKWEKRWSGYHYEKSECDCGCECCCEESLVPDKDAVCYDVYIPYLPSLWSLMPKMPWTNPRFP